MKIVRKSKKPKRHVPVEANTETAQKRRGLMKKKRKDRLKRRFIVFLFLLVCVGVILVVFKAPFFNVKTVYCVGQQEMTEAEILEIAKVKTGGNIFATSIRAVKNRLAENPEIEESNVRRIFPNKIKIWVKEAKAVAFVEHEKRFLMLDRNGLIIRVLAGEEAKNVPAATKIEGIEITAQEPGKHIAEDDMRAAELFECIGILDELGMIEKVNYINFADLSDIQLDYESRLYMLLGSYENMEYKLKFVKKVIDENISEYEKALFDYRGDKLYVGPREDDSQSLEEGQTEKPESGEASDDGAAEKTGDDGTAEKDPAEKKEEGDPAEKSEAQGEQQTPETEPTVNEGTE